jgi:glycosyltransferase involved in cell wall biosynthesis
MRIVIDLQGVQSESRFRGIGRYSLSFSKAIARNRGSHEVFLALSDQFIETIEPIRAAFEGLIPQDNIRVWSSLSPTLESHPGNDQRREVAELIREAFLASLKPDLIHISSLFEGFVDNTVTSIGRFDRDTPVSVSLYDLIPLLNPDQYLKPNPSYEKHYQRKIDFLKKASIYLAISEFARKEGIEHLKVNEKNIVNVSTAIEPQFKSTAIEESASIQLKQKFTIRKPYVMYTGGVDERKNVPRLIQAYAALSKSVRDNHQLLLAGRMPRSKIEEFQSLALKVGLSPNEILFTDYIPDDELAQLYSLCKLFVFPSWHEGFGLPALEAMACGAPVITAKTSSLPEVVGFEAALFDPFDVSAITLKINHALDDETFRNELTARAKQQVGKFSWDSTANRAIQAWVNLCESKKQIVNQPKPTSKLKLAFVSPMLPERTGIADYSAELLPALSEFYEIDVIVNQVDTEFPVTGNAQLKARQVEWFKEHFRQFDRVIYQFGNSPFHYHMLDLSREIPGTLVLHDFFVSGLISWKELHAGIEQSWTESLYVSHGYKAVLDKFQDIDVAKSTYPVNLEILQNANGVIVHSEHSRELAKNWYQNAFANWSVIPHLRTETPKFDVSAARKKLGFNHDDFIVCSFGFLDTTKLNDRLLACWLASNLAREKNSFLVFVGQNQGGQFGQELIRTINASEHKNKIRITGFTSPENYQDYLRSADMAVQLRTNSRGETSGAALDCMNHSLPLIVNAHGSMAELNPNAVSILPNEFNDFELTAALEELWANVDKRQTIGRLSHRIIVDKHSPASCAKLYRDAIEQFYLEGQKKTPKLIETIAKQDSFDPLDVELASFAGSIARSLPQQRSARRLFLDITATQQNDLRTGIERVVRSLIIAFIDNPPVGYRVEPVYLYEMNGNWQYRYARQYTLGLLGCPSSALNDEIVEPEFGDLLLGLDLSGHKIVNAEKAGLLQKYRAKGVKVFFMVYDLLPIQAPEYFPPGANKSHAQWLISIAKFDGVVCISKAVADDFIRWSDDNKLNESNSRPFFIGYSHLGADVNNSVPSKGLPNSAELVLSKINSRPTFLMVGTIEPRKGYLQAIDAFTQLWADGIDANLVIVGKEGWTQLPDDLRRDIPQTLARIKSHPEAGNRFFWLDGISDEYLEKVYKTSSCLIAASYGEGFGLPVIEAAKHGLSLIARDIPVFREIAPLQISFFDGLEPKQLATCVKKWLKQAQPNLGQVSPLNETRTWHESAKALSDILINGHWYASLRNLRNAYDKADERLTLW